MKTETQITEENVKWVEYAKEKNKDTLIEMARGTSEGHKATCQRFLEFAIWIEERVYILSQKKIKDKITDLKQAIKLYNEAGIK